MPDVLRPIDYVKTGLFGQSPNITWLIPPGGAFDELLHAKWQHDIVMQIRVWATHNSEDDPVGYLSEKAEERRQTVVRKFNGKAFASAGNLLRWVIVTAIEVYPVPQASSDLVPEVGDSR